MSTTFSKSPYAHATYSGADMLVTLNIKNTSQHKNVTQVLGELQTLSYSTHMERSGVRKLGNVNVSDFTNGPRTVAGSLVFAVFDRHVMRSIIQKMGIDQETLPDELPPFDITITYANEYGSNSVLRIYGVRLVNEGQVCSVNDVYMENTYQYVATNIETLNTTALENSQNSDSDSSASTENIQGSSNLDNLLDLTTPNNTEEVLSKLIVQQVDFQTYFDATLKTETLILIVEDGIEKEKRYLVEPNNWPIHLILNPGNYKASLKNKSDDLYYTAPFTVAASKPMPPLITKVTSTSVVGKVQQDALSISISNHNDYYNTLDLSNIKSFSFLNLIPGTVYYIQVTSKLGVTSDTIEQKTLENAKGIFDEFKFFIDTNNLTDKDLEEMIRLSKQSQNALNDLGFLEACYNFYIQNKKKTVDTETFMHLISYFDLVYKQKKYHFNFVNKWLNQIEPYSSDCHYRAYNENGVTSNAKQMTGLIKHQQLYNTILEKLTTYKPSSEYQNKLQKEYLLKVETYNKLRQMFNVRYSALPINQEYGFYDEMLYSEGAYIDCTNNRLKACLELSNYSKDNTYFVFKEDIHLDVSFKVKTCDEALNLSSLSFFDPNSNYVVYLESNNISISKSILIENGVCRYAYDTLFSLSPKYKMQDIVQEICMQNNNAFETFCYGIYILVNRKKLSAYYISMFDEWLFSSAKIAPVSYYRQNNMLTFKQEVTMLYFNKYGEFLKIIKGNSFSMPVSGYLIWLTPLHQMQAINFENI